MCGTSNMTLSILIPTVPSRKKLVQKLLTKLEKQIEGYDDIQILCLYDNKSVSTGAKRNKLVSIADSAYICFIDDDDDISDDYISEIYPLAKEYKHDIISFNIMYTDDVGGDKLYDFTEYPPTHVHLRKRENLVHPFPDIQTGEDRDWMLTNSPFFNDIYHIPKTLYTYRFSTTGTETQK